LLFKKDAGVWQWTKTAEACNVRNDNWLVKVNSLRYTFLVAVGPKHCLAIVKSKQKIFSWGSDVEADLSDFKDLQSRVSQVSIKKLITGKLGIQVTMKANDAGKKKSV
jgi:hypothetical protein